MVEVCCLEVKEMETKISRLRDDTEKGFREEREQYDREVREYREIIMNNAADLAKKQRFFYEVVTDNRVLRNRMRKMVTRLNHELESNKYLKEENMIFYKEN